jgi:hypothetical protein
MSVLAIFLSCLLVRTYYFCLKFEAIWSAMERRYASTGMLVPPLPTKVSPTIQNAVTYENASSSPFLPIFDFLCICKGMMFRAFAIKMHRFALS